MTNAELVQLCRVLNLKEGGNRAALVQRVRLPSVAFATAMLPLNRCSSCRCLLCHVHSQGYVLLSRFVVGCTHTHIHAHVTHTTHITIPHTDTQLTAKLNHNHEADKRRQEPPAVAASEVHRAATQHAAAAALRAREAWVDERDRLVAQLDMVSAAGFFGGPCLVQRATRITLYVAGGVVGMPGEPRNAEHLG